MSKRLNINAATVNLAIWDTAGQERFHALGPIYYRDADGARCRLSNPPFVLLLLAPFSVLLRLLHRFERQHAFPRHIVAISFSFFLRLTTAIAGALLVYDITDSESFVKVKNWVKELRKMVSPPSLQSQSCGFILTHEFAGW